MLTVENVNNPVILGALAVLQKKEPLFFDEFMGRYTGTNASLKQELSKKKAEAAGFAIIDGGQVEGTAVDQPKDRWLAQTVADVPLNLVLPGNPFQYASWALKNDGVAAMKINDQGNVTYNKATYAPIIINERISNNDIKPRQSIPII